MECFRSFFIDFNGVYIDCDNIVLRLGNEGYDDYVLLLVDGVVKVSFPINAYDLVFTDYASGTFFYDLVPKKLVLDTLCYNDYYHCYTASSCRATGLPMVGFGYAGYYEHRNDWLSKSRCEKIKKPVTRFENPVAFLRVMNGYVPLYYRRS